jgi:hypothetical protein
MLFLLKNAVFVKNVLLKNVLLKNFLLKNPLPFLDVVKFLKISFFSNLTIRFYFRGQK